MSKFWSPIVATLKPYIAGEQPRIQNLTKLNTNENPYGPSPKAIAVMQAAVTDSLKLYPDPSALALRQSSTSAQIAYARRKSGGWLISGCSGNTMGGRP